MNHYLNEKREVFATTQNALRNPSRIYPEIFSQQVRTNLHSCAVQDRKMENQEKLMVINPDPAIDLNRLRESRRGYFDQGFFVQVSLRRDPCTELPRTPQEHY